MKYFISIFLILTTWLGITLVLADQVQKDIEFSWDAAVCEGTCVNGVDGYKIYTEQGGLVADVQGTVYVANNYAITVGVPSGFYVTAYNVDGESDPSDIATVLVEGTAPSSTTLRAVFK